jgi:heat shock protein HslJ
MRRFARDPQKVVFILCLIGSLSQLACNGDAMTQPVSPSANVGLVGTEWSMVQLNGQPPGGGAGAAAPTLLLAGEDTRASGFAGCNRFTGSYTLASDRLRFSPVALTRMFCNQGMDLEERYMAALAATRAYRLTGSRLELLGDADVIARFEAR